MEATLSPDSSIKDVTVYSLGNFVSNQRGQYRNGGALAALTFEKDSSKISISNTGYHLVWVHTPTINGKKAFRVLPVVDYEAKTDFFNTDDKKLFDEFVKDSRGLLNSQNKLFYEENNSNEFWLSK
jgi:poly-gamma-glutamate synthesis protein (capsule biosynthesis protein)